MTNIEIAIAAPVFPAEMNAEASTVLDEVCRDAQRGVALASEGLRGALGHPDDL